MKSRVKILPILLPILLVLGLLSAAGVTIYLERSNEVSHTDLGQKYLNSMDYNGAAEEFVARLTQDPTDVEARRGLARSYFGMGKTDLASEVLQPLMETKDPEAYRLVIQMETESQDVNQALLDARELVSQTDKEEDYKLLDELFQQVLALPHSYAAGTDQVLLLSDGQVKAAGSNLLGQLGAAAHLGTNERQDRFASAEFQGTAGKVYCAGRTSYVVDAENNLWAAGENRWGQMATGTADMTPQAGWKKIVDSGDVACVAGLTGRLYVLKTDGSLWLSGQGGSMGLERVQEFYQVSALESDGRSVAVLTLDGKLYRSENGGGWNLAARNVKQFSLCSGMLAWITADQQVCTSNGIYYPQEWQTGKTGAIPDFDVLRIACDGNGILLQGTDGILRRLYQGSVSTYDDLHVTSIYGEDGCVVLETESGVRLWQLSETKPTLPPTILP